jgi:WD40 repeat protein
MRARAVTVSWARRLLVFVALAHASCVGAVPTENPAASSTTDVGTPHSAATTTERATETRVVTRDTSPVPSETPSTPAPILPGNVDQVAQIEGPIAVPNRLARLVMRDNHTWIVAPTSESEILIADATTQATVGTLVENGSQIEWLGTSPSGRLLVALSPQAKRLSVWNLDTLNREVQLGLVALRSPDEAVVSLSGVFSDDEKKLAVAGCLELVANGGVPLCGRSYMAIYDLVSGEILRTIELSQANVEDVAFSPDSRLLAAASQSNGDSDLLVWDFAQDEVVTSTSLEDDAGLVDVAYSADGRALAAVATDGAVYIWSSKDWTMRAVSISPDRMAGRVTFVPGSELLVTADFGSGITIWDLESLRPLRTISTKVGVIYDIAVANDGGILHLFSDDLSGQYHIWKWGIP